MGSPELYWQCPECGYMILETEHDGCEIGAEDDEALTQLADRIEALEKKIARLTKEISGSHLDGGEG